MLYMILVTYILVLVNGFVFAIGERMFTTEDRTQRLLIFYAIVLWPIAIIVFIIYLIIKFHTYKKEES